MSTIRLATVADADELARLRWDFRLEHGTTPTMSFDEFREGFCRFVGAALGEGGAWRVWVAEDTGRLVGGAWLQVVERVPHPSLRRGERPIGYLTNVYVEPEARDGGLGSDLLAEVLTWGRERKLDLVVVWPSERSFSFYERAGFGRPEEALVLVIEGD
jgi:GNAT superfamily N-acetyltransferase